jgi:hypothetical protein
MQIAVGTSQSSRLDEAMQAFLLVQIHGSGQRKDLRHHQRTCGRRPDAAQTPLQPGHAQHLAFLHPVAAQIVR